MKKIYQKPRILANRIIVQSALLTESYKGEKGGISDKPGEQSDFSAKEGIWGELW